MIKQLIECDIYYTYILTSYIEINKHCCLSPTLIFNINLNTRLKALELYSKSDEEVKYEKYSNICKGYYKEYLNYTKCKTFMKMYTIELSFKKIFDNIEYIIEEYDRIYNEQLKESIRIYNVIYDYYLEFHKELCLEYNIAIKDNQDYLDLIKKFPNLDMTIYRKMD